ncbi:MAG: hypothetical protein BWK80_42180 [Desulfobacteraceae bacterium IS3]|nr:MAG: hypothetical protein BWK80_42180 [Desulfobacteraceae bacterium IS3]
MDDILFNELLDSIKEAGKIKRGEIKPSRIFICEEKIFEAKEELNSVNFSKFPKQVEKAARQS